MARERRPGRRPAGAAGAGLGGRRPGPAAAAGTDPRPPDAPHPHGAVGATDDVVQQLLLKILQNQDRFWVDAHGQPLRSLAAFFGHTSAWMRHAGDLGRIPVAEGG
jgi:hypothetical protein